MQAREGRRLLHTQQSRGLGLQSRNIGAETGISCERIDHMDGAGVREQGGEGAGCRRELEAHSEGEVSQLFFILAPCLKFFSVLPNFLIQFF